MTSDDVYGVVIKMQTVLYVLCALIVIQIIAKIVILGRVIILMKRVETLLGLVEEHAKITDTKTERVALAAHTAALEAKIGQDEIPKRVAELLRTELASGTSGDSLPVVPQQPPPWHPGDPDRRGPQP